MKREYLYTILFTFAVTAGFTAILAAANAAFLPIIERNEALAERRAVLYVLGIPFESDAEVETAFTEVIRQESVAGTVIFVHEEEGRYLAYAVPFEGSGLWGTIRGFLAVSADLSEIVGIEFTEQNETPGLGSRIEEQWYKEQYRGIPLDDQGAVLTDDTGADRVDAITGATSTSVAVIGIVERESARIVNTLEAVVQ